MSRFAHARHPRISRKLVAAILVASATTSALGAITTTAGASIKKGSGPVDVAYAASLQTIMEQVVGPQFNKATGYSFTGFSGASGTLSTEIKGGTLQADVFISANIATNLTLQGISNGNWENWYDVFANSPLVIGYNPNSTFATALKTEPWWKVVTQTGFRLGRTDPVTDPKGKLAVQAVTAGVQIYNYPGLAAVTASTSNIYPEQTLVGLLQSGQLDAGFFYASEAKAAHIPTVKLGGIKLAATYTVTILNNSPHAAAAAAFLEYLLGKKGTVNLRREGATIVKHRLIGDKTEVPKALRGLV